MPVRRSQHAAGGIVLDLFDRQLPSTAKHDAFQHDEATGLKVDRWTGLADVDYCLTIESNVDRARADGEELTSASTELHDLFDGDHLGTRTADQSHGFDLGGTALTFVVGNLAWEAIKLLFDKARAKRGPSGKAEMTSSLAETHARASLARLYSDGDTTTSERFTLVVDQLSEGVWVLRFEDSTDPTFIYEVRFPADDPEVTLVNRTRAN